MSSDEGYLIISEGWIPSVNIFKFNNFEIRIELFGIVGAIALAIMHYIRSIIGYSDNIIFLIIPLLLLSLYIIFLSLSIRLVIIKRAITQDMLFASGYDKGIDDLMKIINSIFTESNNIRNSDVSYTTPLFIMFKFKYDFILIPRGGHDLTIMAWEPNQFRDDFFPLPGIFVGPVGKMNEQLNQSLLSAISGSNA